MTERATARQIVRDDAHDNNWTITDFPTMDVFQYGPITISMVWSTRDPERVAQSVLVRDNAGIAFSDASPMCIVRCRNWLNEFTNPERWAPATTDA